MRFPNARCKVGPNEAVSEMIRDELRSDTGAEVSVQRVPA
jgi:hypothetical protein